MNASQIYIIDCIAAVITMSLFFLAVLITSSKGKRRK